MNSLMRAQRFIAQKATRLATVIVPLAALAVSAIPAHADATFSSGSCTATPVGNCSTFSQAPSGSVGVSGLATASSAQTVEFDATGAASGTVESGLIPVAWDFRVLPFGSGGGAATVDWTVTFTVDVDPGTGPVSPAPSFTESGATLTGNEVIGSGGIAVPAGTPLDWTATLKTSSASPYVVTGGELLQIDTQMNAVPEPATAFLIPLSAGALLFMRRRKKA
jgi:hypothetical protein